MLQDGFEGGAESPGAEVPGAGYVLRELLWNQDEEAAGNYLPGPSADAQFPLSGGAQSYGEALLLRIHIEIRLFLHFFCCKHNNLYGMKCQFCSRFKS